MNGRELRSCFARFASGVTVVSCDTGSGPHGITVSAFVPVSLDPPLVLVSIGRERRACALLEGAPFTVNVLRAEHARLALHFSGRPQDDVAVGWERGGAAPRMKGALAHVECSPWCSYDGGDHRIFIGRVETFRYGDGEALGFYGGEFCRISCATMPAGAAPGLDELS